MKVVRFFETSGITRPYGATTQKTYLLNNQAVETLSHCFLIAKNIFIYDCFTLPFLVLVDT
jgi:hypothetical protein